MLCTFPRVNIVVGPKEERMMTTGLHTVSDIFCVCCNQIVGWKYVSPFAKPKNRGNLGFLSVVAVVWVLVQFFEMILAGKSL